MTHFSKRLFLINLLGTLFYLSCLLQWTWAILPYIPGIVRLTEILQGPTNTPEPVQEVMASGPPSLTLFIFSIAATVIIIGLTLYVLIKFPVTVAKSGQKITQNTSAHIVPIITHHAKLTPKKRQRLTARVIAYLKLTLCVIPIVLSGCAFFVKTDLAYEIIMIIAAALGIVTLTLLGVQLLCAKWLQVKSDAIW